ncbi:CoA transferase [Defluviimonas sp. D31]|uniref:CoA transferase n=1 Tax=Defluviimonas sp. D31 TaxID=3083253 RepID=UPI00296F9B46|nr:CoA transferase [Defluviimonas sp. D31]MDW4551553.1 CoA transferase [Defluviimonas sp. D31]
MTGILEGIRVLDLSRMLSGPYCTMLLADHGAEVIKIEDRTGDTSRQNGPFRDDDPNHDWAGYFVSLNRSKKSVQLDLKTEAGKTAFRALAATADVVVENFRPGVMERLGLSYESLAELNPRLVYAAIRGFGDPRSGTSPYQNWPAYDVVAQAMGGLVALTGPNAETPTKVGPGIGDVFAGSLMAFAILAALREAEATGRGQFVDIAMYDAMVSLCERAIYQHDFDGTVPGPEGNGHPLLAPFGIFPAKDGHVALGIVDDAFWVKLATAMGRAELGSDPRYVTRAARRANSAEVNALVSDWTGARTKADLADSLGGLVPFGPVNTVADIAADPHVAARGMIAKVAHAEPGLRPWRIAGNPVKFSAHPVPEYQPPERIGQSNGEFMGAAAPPALDARALRNAFGAFATGVTVLTTRQADGAPRGFTANSFTSVSLDPPLLLVCLAKTAHSCATFMEADHFAVNVLAEHQKAVSGLFAGRTLDKFDQCAWTPGTQDVPLIDGALSQFACARERLVDAGDHIVLIGRVIDFATSDGDPLGYFRGNYFSIGLEDRLVSAVAATGATRIGAVLNNDGRLLLCEGPDGALSVPVARGPKPSLDTLRAGLVADGLSPEVEFLYAVYEDRETGTTGIFYHGQVSGDAPKGMVYLPLDTLPWNRVASVAERSMLERYAGEFRHGSFGIYQGNEITGKVRHVTAS